MTKLLDNENKSFVGNRWSSYSSFIRDAIIKEDVVLHSGFTLESLGMFFKNPDVSAISCTS